MREIRFKFIGVIALFVVILFLFLSDPSKDGVTISRFNFLIDPNIVSLLVFIAAFVASEGIGYIFSSIIIFLWIFCIWGFFRNTRARIKSNFKHRL